MCPLILHWPIITEKMLTWIYLLLECFDYPLISTYKVRKSMALLPGCGSFENLSFSQNRLRFKLTYLCNWNWFGQTNKTWYRKQRLITFGFESVSSQLNCSLPVKQAEYLKCRTTVSLQIRTKKPERSCPYRSSQHWDLQRWWVGVDRLYICGSCAIFGAGNPQ